MQLLRSEEELLVEEQFVVDFPKFAKDVQSLAESADVLQCQPVLIQFLVDPMHISGQAFILNDGKGTCFLMRAFCAWTAIRDSSIFLWLCMRSYMIFWCFCSSMCSSLSLRCRSSSLVR